VALGFPSWAANDEEAPHFQGARSPAPAVNPLNFKNSLLVFMIFLLLNQISVTNRWMDINKKSPLGDLEVRKVDQRDNKF
jgi:hypothetical protein